MDPAPSSSWSSSVQAARLPGPGDVIADRYRLAEEVGRGGMGVVYAAEDLKLGRRVAVKLVRPGAQAPDAVQRFEREARAAASLQHANVVAIHDAGVHGDCPYLVAEFLRGTTLRIHLQKGRLSLRQALSFGMLVARGLGAAHERGIVHRDLKPENVFITDHGWPKLVDFGIAKLHAEENTGDTSSESSDRTALETLTAEGSFVGTVGYASPEQVRGQPADARSDVFSFGAVLYEMICGERAFTGATRFDTCFAIVNGQPRPLSREVPEALCQLVDRCLKKDPAERFQSAVEVGASLDAISQQLGVTDPALRYPQQATTMKLRLDGTRAKIAVAAAIVLAGAAVGLGIRTRRHLPMTQPLSSRLEALAAISTRSPEARAAFAQGEEALRRGLRREARDAYQKALVLEPDFPLALYRLSVASRNDAPGLAADALERAMMYSAKLDPRERSLLAATFAMRNGDVAAAESALRALVARHPDDIEGFRQLGDLLYHFNPLFGRSALEALDPFARLLTLDPTDFDALDHSIDLALMQGSRPVVRELAGRYLAAVGESGPAVTLPARWARAWATGDILAGRALLDEVRTAPISVQQAVWWRATWEDGDLTSLHLLAAVLSTTGTLQQRSLWVAADAIAELAQGRPEAARARFSEARQLAGGSGNLYHALWMETLDFVPVSPGRLAEARREVTDIEVPKPSFLGAKLHLAGALAARAGDHAGAEAAATALEALPPLAGTTVTGDMALAVRARDADAAGKPDEALRLLREMKLRVSYQHAGFYSRLSEQRLRAALLASLGRIEEAADWEVQLYYNPQEIAYRAPRHLRLASLAARRGDLEVAREHARKALEVWRNAEPAMQPMLEEARRLVAVPPAPQPAAAKLAASPVQAAAASK